MPTNKTNKTTFLKITLQAKSFLFQFFFKESWQSRKLYLLGVFFWSVQERRYVSS